jgi:uncharacterized protein YbaA (DUF1428 family)
VTYIDGFLAAVPQANKNAYVEHAHTALPLFKQHGAARMVENWGDEVPDGTVTDFNRSVQKKADEVVVFSWIEWPSKPVRDAGMQALTEDERMKTLDMPYDGGRMVYGGFSMLVDRGTPAGTGFVDGFVTPVPATDRAVFQAMASTMADLFIEHGALRVVEAWGDDVPEGKVTDFRRAVAAQTGEAIVFGWIEWPSKSVRNEAWQKVMADPKSSDPEGKTFDGKRMIYGGFTTIFDA